MYSYNIFLYHVLVTRDVSEQRRELLLGEQTQHGHVERHGRFLHQNNWNNDSKLLG